MSLHTRCAAIINWYSRYGRRYSDSDAPSRPRIGVLLVLAASFSTAVSALGLAPPERATLTTARIIHGLTTEQASRAYPVRLQATVTYYNPWLTEQHAGMFAVDATGSIFVELSSIPATGFKAGDLIEIKGVSGPGNFAPIIDQAEARLIGRSHLPSIAPKVGVKDMLTGGYDGQWVQVEGVVHAIRESAHNSYLELVLSDGSLVAMTNKQAGVDYHSLIDARVSLRGNEVPMFNHQGQMTGVHMNFPDLSTVKILETAAHDPFTLPVQRVGSLLRYNPETAFNRRVHVQGLVTLLWPGRLLCIQDEAQGLCSETRVTTPLQPGELVDVAGFPSVGETIPILTHATYQAVSMNRASSVHPVAAIAAISAKEALQGNHDAKLVEIEGRLIGKELTANDPTIILSSGNSVFAAVLPNQSLERLMPTLEEGTLIRVVGICSVQSDDSAVPVGEGFSIPKTFRILLRSPDDVIVVRRPSWWNAAHTLRVLALALGITLIALSSVAMLGHRVRQQTAVIRSQLVETAALKDAAEAASRAALFEATHDGLTGIRNRVAIFDLLHREFALAAREGTATGVMMLDLDHFKKINDTYGHMAGDEVLKESVRRLLRALRSSDLVGRYGGEEFLIVLPHCDKTQVQMCAERIRVAISGEPMVVAGALITMTASMGTAVATSSLHTEQETLAAADIALYDAKNSGRNRVVLHELKAQELLEPAAIA